MRQDYFKLSKKKKLEEARRMLSVAEAERGQAEAALQVAKEEFALAEEKKVVIFRREDDGEVVPCAERQAMEKEWDVAKFKNDAAKRALQSARESVLGWRREVESLEFILEREAKK